MMFRSKVLIMNTVLRIAQDRPGPTLTIGALAERTGVAVHTLRAWETRFGFPEPRRLDNGHRRYAERDVAQVLDVLARRERGTHLEVAIRQARTASSESGTETPRSLYAYLSRHHPEQSFQRLRKSTLLGLSWAIEDEFCAKAERANIFGAFETAENYRAAQPRWEALGRVAATSHVFADFESTDLDATPAQIALAPDVAMRREWAVVCDSVELPVALTAWEIPGQTGVRDRDRVFESIWTVDPVAVRTAARMCADVAAAAGSPVAAELLAGALSPPARTGAADLLTVSRLVSRVASYVDEATRR